MAAAYSENNKKNKHNLRAKCTVFNVRGMLHIATLSLEGFIYVSGFQLKVVSFTFKGKHCLAHISLSSEPTSQANPQISSETNTVYWEISRRRGPTPPLLLRDKFITCAQKLKNIPTLIHQHPATSLYSTVLKLRFNSTPFKSNICKWILDFKFSHWTTVSYMWRHFSSASVPKHPHLFLPSGRRACNTAT
jgi:hypothetical protein